MCFVWLQDALVAAEAHVLLVETLKTYHDHAGVAERACNALADLARDNSANQVTSAGETTPNCGVDAWRAARYEGTNVDREERVRW